jgi:hypothetical protein
VLLLLRDEDVETVGARVAGPPPLDAGEDRLAAEPTTLSFHDPRADEDELASDR